MGVSLVEARITSASTLSRDGTKSLHSGMLPTDSTLESMHGSVMTQSEIYIERKREENHQQALIHWRLLRNSIRDTIKAVSEADKKNLLMCHGMHHSRKLNHPETITDAIYVSKTKEYVTCDGNFVRVFHEDGRRKSVITPEEPIDRILYSSHTDQFVGYRKGGKKLMLLNGDFEILSSVNAPKRIDLAQYNVAGKDVITIGPGTVSSWSFRYGARYLIPRKISHLVGYEKNVFEHMALEQTASKAQKCFFSASTGVVVFCLEEGRVIAHKRDLHVRSITALGFFNPLKYLLTGSTDGSIKVWSADWHVVRVFIGHSEQVNVLAIYPFCPAIMSASLDKTVRVWSLETGQQIDRVNIHTPIINMTTEFQRSGFFMQYDMAVELWEIRHLHQIHTYTGYRVDLIKMTTHPSRPIRAVVMSMDSSIRIVTPLTGDIITTLLLNPKSHAVDTAHAIAENCMFVILKNGDIVKCRTDTNPCRVVAEWPCPDPEEACNCLLVYEYVVDALLQVDVWSGIKRALTTQSIKAASSVPQRNCNRTLLLGGRKDGYICVFNWITGEVDFKLEGHGCNGVLTMMANSKEDQLITAGMDNIIKVWRLYPFAEESLAPLMSFYCAHTPTHMCMMKSNLCVTFQDVPTATYSVVVYNLQSKNRRDHSSDDDHFDLITGLSSCPRLGLFATCSRDGTIRIWNEYNNLFRILKLNAIPHSIGFCSQRADILVGLADHLYKIEYSAYMPIAYRHKMVCMKFATEVAAKPLPYTESLTCLLTTEDLKRLNDARSSYKFTELGDKLSEIEEEVIKKEVELKSKAYSLLEARERDLRKIRDGELKAKKPPLNHRKIEYEAFMNYYKMHYYRPQIKIPKEESFYPSDKSGHLDDDNMWKPETCGGGFFPAPDKVQLPSITPKEDGDTEEESSVQVINPYGFIPNSVLVRILWPPALRKEYTEKQMYMPPDITDSQIAQIDQQKEEDEEEAEEEGGLRTSPALSTGKSRKVRIAEYANLKFEYEDESDVEEEEPQSLEKLLESKQQDMHKEASSLLSKYQELATKPPSPTEEIEEVEYKPTFITQPDDISAPRPPPKASVTATSATAATSITKPRKPPVRRPLKPKPVPVETVEKPVTPPPPKEPTPVPPSPPPSPLPDFITQFERTEWFEKHFPDCNSNTLAKPWTADAFAVMLVKALRADDNVEYMIGMVEALVLLHCQQGLTAPDVICRTFLSVLNHYPPMSCIVVDEKKLIEVSLRAVLGMGTLDKEYVSELMIQYMDGDSDMRLTVKQIFMALGVHDPQQFFYNELDSWDTWHVDDDQRKPQIHIMCHQWLDRWLSSFKHHIEETLRKLKKGQNVHGRVNKAQASKLHKVSENSSPSDSPVRNRNLTVTINSSADSSLLENATYIEAINYFCEITCEKEFNSMHVSTGTSAKKQSAEKRELVKNTVLVLPRIQQCTALVRLGESHTGPIREKRQQGAYHPAYGAAVNPYDKYARGAHISAPGEINGFAPAIHMPMKTLYLNPFPSEIDDADLRFQEPILITLKSSQKFFFPDLSCVPAASFPALTAAPTMVSPSASVVR